MNHEEIDTNQMDNVSMQSEIRDLSNSARRESYRDQVKDPNKPRIIGNRYINQGLDYGVRQ